jgi:hypothetical protein
VIEGNNLEVLATLPDESVTLIYIDPPFNTGREQSRSKVTSVLAADDSTKGLVGFKGKSYERTRSDLMKYDDRFDDYWAFLEPRLREAWRLLTDDGTLYLHLDYREAHYAKVMLDALFGRDSFINELIWAYDYGAKAKGRWPAKHDTILVYVKNPKSYYSPPMCGGTPSSRPQAKRRLVTPHKNLKVFCAASFRLPVARVTPCSTSLPAVARQELLLQPWAATLLSLIKTRKRSP